MEKTNAKNVKRQNTIRVEYGVPGNWVNFVVDNVTRQKDKIIVSCHNDSLNTNEDFKFQSNELINVVN